VADVRRGVFVVCAVAGLALASACQWIAGLEDRTVAAKDASVEAGDDAATDPCKVVGVPIRPSADASAPTDPQDIVFALTAIDFGFDGGPPSGRYGLNLDLTCTCPGADSCIRPPDAGSACDLPNGVDNNGNLLFLKAQQLQFVTQDQLNGALASGQSGALIRLSQYNGQSNDSLARVSVYSSLGLEGVYDGGSPTFDGNDRWTIDQESVIGQDPDGGLVPSHSDPSAFVADGNIVATLDFPVTIGSTTTSPVTVQLTAGRIFATLGKNSQNVRTLSGIFAGRWEATKMLTSFQNFQDPLSPSQFVCGTDPVYAILHDVVCNLVDIARLETLDNNNNPCDALAVGIHFEAVEAKFGAVTPEADAGFPCGPSWTGSCP
jgi:hypothetical protein